MKNDPNEPKVSIIDGNEPISKIPEIDLGDIQGPDGTTMREKYPEIE